MTLSGKTRLRCRSVQQRQRALWHEISQRSLVHGVALTCGRSVRRGGALQAELGLRCEWAVHTRFDRPRTPLAAGKLLGMMDVSAHRPSQHWSSCKSRMFQIVVHLVISTPRAATGLLL